MGDVNALLAQAAEACRRRQCDDAVASLEDAVRLLPADPDIHYRLGVCYAGGCGLRAGRNPETGIAYLRHSLSLLGPRAEHQLARARILDAMARAYLATGGASTSERIQAAIDCCQEAAGLYRDVGQMEEWAREEFNLGNICCDLTAVEFPRKWEDAVRHYEKSLEVRTAAGDTIAHAATLQNLATAYRELTTGDRGQNVHRAILHSFAALRIYRTTGMRINCAALHNNIGNAYLSLPARGAPEALRNIRRALRHFERALLVRTRTERPLEYASTQFNRGEALVSLSALGARDLLPLAEACFLEAAECFATLGLPDLASQARNRQRQLHTT